MLERLAALSASDVVHCLLVHFVIQVSRDESCLHGGRGSLMQMFCYLSDSIDGSEVRQLHSLEHFLSIIATYTIESELVDEFVAFCRGIVSMDSVIEFMDRLKSIFEVESSASSNNLYGPNKISVTSALGLFVRRCSSFWECMEFSAQCTTLSDLQRFVSSSNSSEVAVDRNWTNKANVCESRAMTQFIDTLEALLHSRSLVAAEELIHGFFDKLPQDPLAIRYRSAQDPKTTEQLLQELRFLESGNSLIPPKHQFAMMSLALLWIHAGNLQMAQSAIEEALKCAHQRGDHSSVVKCMLLLCKVLDLSGDADNLHTQEELLLRCAAKSASLNLSDLSAEAILAFGQLQSGALTMQSSLPSMDSAAWKVSNTEKITWSPSEVWNLLMLNMLGEPALAVRYSASRTVGSIDDIAATGVTAAQQQQHQQQQHGKSAADIVMQVDDTRRLLEQRCGLLIAELWFKASVPAVALVQCQREMQRLGEDNLDIVVASVIKLVIASLQVRLSDNQATKQEITEHVANLLKSVKSLHNHWRTSVCSAYLEQCMDLPTLLLSLLLCLLSDKEDRAQQFAMHIQFLVSDINSNSFLPKVDQVRLLVVSTTVEHVTKRNHESRYVQELVLELCTTHGCPHVAKEPLTTWLLTSIR